MNMKNGPSDNEYATACVDDVDTANDDRSNDDTDKCNDDDNCNVHDVVNDKDKDKNNGRTINTDVSRNA